MDLSDVSLLNILPPNLAKDKNVQMAVKAFDEVLREIIAKIPGVSIIPKISEITDHLLLDLLAWQFHCDFYNPELSIDAKREVVLKSLDWHTRKGTPSVIEEVVSAVISGAEVEEWFLSGGPPYTFQVITEQTLANTEDIKKLYDAISSVKNTRSWLDAITSMIQATMKFYYGIGVYFDDLIVMRSVVTAHTDPAVIYVATYPNIGGRVDIPFNEEDLLLLEAS